MNKAELVDKIASDAGLSKASAKLALESFIQNVQKSLKKGHSVVLTGFGSFVVVQRKARVGINPATQKKMNIPAKKVPRFKPGKDLKEAV